jgi:hypothetical protein
MNVRDGSTLFPLLAIAPMVLLGLTGCGGKPEAKLTASAGTASMNPPNALLTALTIANDGSAAAEDVQITSVAIAGATLTLPASLPSSVGAIPRGGDATLDANFTSPSAAPNTDYVVNIAGNFREHGRRFDFALQQTVHTLPAAAGSGTSLSGSAPTQHVSGATFPPQPPNFGNEINDSGATRHVPSGLVRPLTPSTASGVQPAPHGSGGGGSGASISFPTNAPLGIQSSTVAEPSGASGGGVVFETANWYAAFSTNGGANFSQLNPTTIFPNNIDGGFCCDQIVQYVPSIDRFVWVMQYSPTTAGTSTTAALGPNLYRVASASPAQVKSSGGTAWDYFDIGSQVVLGTTGSPWFDYPDVSYGNTFLYLSADALNNFPNHVVIRISLSDIKANGTIHFNWSTPSDSGVVWGGHISQNTRDQVFWAGHVDSSDIRIFNWPESSGTYNWRTIAIGTWPQTSSSTLMTSIAKGGQDWLAKLSNFPNNAVLGLARTIATSDKRGANQLYLAWTGAIGNGFPQPQVQWIAVDIDNNFALVSQQQVWNPGYAYAYPAFAVNSKNELGMSLEWGGGGNYENHVAGFWGDFVVYQTTNSNVGPPTPAPPCPCLPRFGDYVTIRPNTANPALFDAFGYGLLQSTPPGNPISDVHYIVFGR